jgi:hypothetical protein
MRRKASGFALGAVLLLAVAASLLSQPVRRTWQSYRNHLDFCGDARVPTSGQQRVAAAIDYVRQPHFHRQALIFTHGKLDTWAHIDPATCCSVIFGGRVGDYAITPQTVFAGGPAAYVRFDTLPPYTAGGEKLSILTDRCGQVYLL